MARAKTREFTVAFDPGRDRYVTKDEDGNLLAVDRSMNMAIGSATREAGLASRTGVRVKVMVQNDKGKYRQEFVAEPPGARP